MLNFFSEKKRLLTFLAVILILIAIPLTVIISKQQQQIKQRASGQQISLYFTSSRNCNAPLTSPINLTINQLTPLSLCLSNTTEYSSGISGFDITLSASANISLTFQSVTASADADRFGSTPPPQILSQNKAIRLTRIITNDNILDSPLRILDFTLLSTIAENGSITIPTPKIVSLTQDALLTVDNTALSYNSTLSSPTIPPTPTPTLAPGVPTPTPTPTPIPSSQCAVSDCEVCAVGASCQQVPGVTRKSCSCQLTAATPTPVPGTPTPTPISTPTPTLTPAGPTTILNFQPFELSEIQPNINHNDLSLTVYLYKSADDPSLDLTGKNPFKKVTVDKFLKYDKLENKFFGDKFNLGPIADGTYKTLIKIPKYLRKSIINITTTLSAGASINIPNVTNLIAGDINGDNKLDILDYNILSACIDSSLPISDPKSKFNSVRCKGFGGQNVDLTNADINDDGFTDQIDYNILIRNINFTSRSGN